MATMGDSPGASGQGFVNPYNFVPLHTCRRDSLPEDAHLVVGGRTGRLLVELELLTPASVSPMTSNDPDDLAEGDRLELSDIPRWRPRRDEAGHVWIPGSSLKGAFRTVLEALSESCFSVFDKEKRYSWRPIRPSRPGFLFRRSEEEFFVEPATDIRIGDHPGWATGERRSVQALPRGRGMLYESPSGRRYDGTVVIAEVPKESTKRWQRLFVPSGRAPLAVSPGLVDASDLAHEQQISEDDGKPQFIGVGDGRRRRRQKLAEMADGERRAVWYRVDDRGAVVSLGPVSLFREMWEPSAGDLLAREPGPSLLPCGGGETVCAACRMFGLTWRDAERWQSSGWRGLVGFGPARSDAPVPRRRPVVLPPAGAPRPSAQTFYLWDPRRPGAPDASWFGSTAARLRGRKLYWHQPGTTEESVALDGVQRQDILNSSHHPAKQLRAVELIPTGTRLRFEVRFEGLTAADLGLLVLTLEPERLVRRLGRTGAELAHRIGGGKPLGLGSARVRIVEATSLSTERYRSLTAAGESPLDLEPGVEAAVREYDLVSSRPDLDALLTMLDLRAVQAGTRVRYPPGPEDLPHRSYEWFGTFAKRDRDGRPRDADPLRSVSEVRSGARQRTEVPRGGRGRR